MNITSIKNIFYKQKPDKKYINSKSTQKFNIRKASSCS